MSEKFQRFGKYLILDHLVDGGMAKICRARYLGEQANKVVAIKMVQPQFSNDDTFARMFQDELNITFGMLHPNIMQVYDYGKTNGQLYTAMEYIHGANLKQYLDRLKEKKVVFPVEISCYIISQVCQGLHYAHTFTDKLTGKPFNIVHRDISPHNIMLTYDGAVKVIDFGIAKANTNSEATQAGTIKGKLSYLAPEYLDGLELDARYDEFAVGITLWELLCSRKLFQANNDLAVLKIIQACKVPPPSSINPSVPKELDAIVMKALSKDRSHRYENLDQMNRALVKFLYSTYPEFNASDLKGFADDLFKAEIAKDRTKFVEYGSINITPYIEDLKKDESRTGKIARKEAAGKPLPPKTTVREIVLEIDTHPQAPIEVMSKEEMTGTLKLSKEKLQSAKVTSRNAKVNSSGPTSRKIDREKTSTSVRGKGDDKEESGSSSRPMMIIIFAASFAAFAYFQPDTFESLTGFNFRKNERKISSVPVSKSLDAEKDSHSELQGKVILGGLDMSMEVYIDGEKREYTGLPIKVSLDRDVQILIKKSGYLPYSKKISLTKDAYSTVINVPQLQRARLGLLTTSQNYTAGSKLVYEYGGETFQRDLPIKDLAIPQGTYEAKVINPILGTEKKVEFTIEENKKHFLE